MTIDANVHATLNGRWFDSDLDASLGALLAAMDAAGIDRGVLTGLGSEIPTPEVLELCAASAGRLLPVGAFDPTAHATPEAVRVAARAELPGRGLLGVKLHPRLGRYDLLDERVLAFLDELAGWDERLGVWICTLVHVPGLRLRRGPVETLTELVGRWPELTFVLVHGGGPDLLALATALRPATNAMLDLSYTLTRLRRSSVRMDLEHLMHEFEQRLVFGSDFPEGDITLARSEVEALAPADVGPLVLGANLERALGLA